MATGVHGKSVANEFKEHADAEREHADLLAERIQQLGGKPDFNPGSLVRRSVSQYIEGETLGDMIREDLIAERVVIEVYSGMIRYFGDKDSTTRVLIEKVLADEEEHAADLTDLLYIVEPSTGETEGIDPGTDPLAMSQGRRDTSKAAQPTQRRNEPAARSAVADIGSRIGKASDAGEREVRPGRAPVRERAESATPAHVPGTTGHPIHQRPQQMQEIDEEPATGREEGGQMGATRAVRVTKPNRKNRVA
jgi:bacterioferritin (cytochrome b1)